MKRSKSAVITIGYGRHLFVSTNNERKRLELCAQAVSSLDSIVFTKQSDQLDVVKTDVGLTLYPTNSASKLTMMFDAYKIAVRLIKSRASLPVVTTQDPFETGLIGLILKFRYRVHLTVQEHGDFYSRDYWKRESLLNRARYYLGIFILKKADTIRVVSDKIRLTLSTRYVSSKKINQLPVAIETAKFTDPDLQPADRSVFPADSFIFLSVARFVPQKNISLLIEAFALTYTQNPAVRLLLVGSGSEERTLRSIIKRHWANSSEKDCPVQLLPWSDNVPSLMAATDAYVLSSNYEGWGRVLIEAILCDLPIVTTDVGCAGEVVKNGEHGFVVPVGDVTPLSQALLKISSDKTTYESFRQNIAALKKTDLPGVNITQYGYLWERSLYSANKPAILIDNGTT